MVCLPAHAQMGSPGGGETQAIVLHPTNPQIIYVGAAKGLCKTTQAGQDNWPSTGLANLGPRHIVLDPSNPDLSYTGTYKMGVPVVRPRPHPHRNASVMNGESSPAQFSDNANVLSADGIFAHHRWRRYRDSIGQLSPTALT